MTKKMQGAVLDGIMSIAVHEVDMPVPRPDEALIRVHCIGVCGSDIHYYEHGRIGRYVVDSPLILGHELAGQVVEVGANVRNIEPGDRVAVEPGIPCDRCDYCKAGRYNLCPDVRFMATPPIDGAWAEYVAVRSDFLHRLPDELSYEEGALLEPLSVGFHAMRRAGLGPSDRIYISGLGPVGLLAVTAARMHGVSRIIGGDVLPLRREMARELGADAVLDPADESVADRLSELTGNRGVTAVIESSGNARAVADTIGNVRRGGKVVLIGLPTSREIPLDVTQLVDKELDVLGVFRYANTYPAAIDALLHDDHPIERIVTHRFALDEIATACEVARTQKDLSVKVMIYPHSPDARAHV